ncbi:MAG: YHS domain-containing protein [Deltaproteobacteria bacterium]|nr:YHS domain-containing protein [Deltaproteobacteria bacterium]
MIFRLLLAIIIVYLIYRLARSLVPAGGTRGRRERKIAPAGPGEELVQDPYCGTYVPISDAYRVSDGGKTLFFCSEECWRKYHDAQKGGQEG